MPSFIEDMFEFRRRRTPGKEAIFDWDHQKSYSWLEMHERAEKLAGFLVYELGLRKGARIGFLCPTDISMIDSLLVSFKTGLIVSVYNYRLSSKELASMLDNERPSVVFISSKMHAKFQEIAAMAQTRFSAVCVDDGVFPAVYSLGKIYRSSYPVVGQANLDPDDTAMLVHTGGTTGRPKSAILPYRNLFLNAIAEIVEFHLTENDCAYVCMPFFHTGGWNVFTVAMMLLGGKLVLGCRFSPDAFFDVVERERPTILMMADAMYNAIVHHPRFEDADLSCFRFVTAAASTPSEESMRPFWDRGIRFYNGYGATEIGPNNCIVDVNISLEQNMSKPTTIGKPLLFTQMRIVDGDGNDLPAGQRGEIVVKSGLQFNGYWNNEEETAAAIEDGWVHTGDIGYCDEDGDYYICGRIKHMYISGGENIFSTEIEDAFRRHPAVEDIYVLGVPDEQWGEVGKAVIVLKSGAKASIGEFEEFARVLPSIKRPRHYVFADEIPRNEAGKYDRGAIHGRWG